jgi:hypothetical protein
MCIDTPKEKAAVPAKPEAVGLPQKDTRLSYSTFGIPGLSFNPIGFLELPLLLVLAYTCRAHFRWGLLGPMFVWYLWKECVPMSTCLHRYFSHKGFKCGRVTQFGLYLLGCLASQVRARQGDRKSNTARRQPGARSRPPATRVTHAATAAASALTITTPHTAFRPARSRVYPRRCHAFQAAPFRDSNFLGLPIPSLTDKKTFPFLLCLLPTQGPPLWWASKHRKHHGHCDTKEDPHSPVAYSKMYAWLGWAYLPSGDGPFGRGHDQDYLQAGA